MVRKCLNKESIQSELCNEWLSSEMKKFNNMEILFHTIPEYTSP